MLNVRAALLAGGLGERMGRLTGDTCKPLVPYAGSCHLVDFSMANAVRSGIPEVVLLSLHRERDLVDHLARHWDGAGIRVNFGPHDELVRSGGPAPGAALPARPAESGTADALVNNAAYLFAPGVRDVLVQHADHVYAFDYAPMVGAHRRSGADVTIGVQRVERRFVRLFGMVEVEEDLRVRRIVEKPADPTSDLVFTAFCLFRADALQEVLAALSALGEDGWQHDISRDVLPRMIEEGRHVRAYPVSGYWADIGTVERYHLEQMRLLDRPSPLPPAEVPRTLAGAPPWFDARTGSLVGGDPPSGAVLRSSLLFPGCVVEPGATVERSVVLPGARIRAGVRLRDAVAAAGEDVRNSRDGVADLEPA